jgi:hypothetical protein
MSSTPRRLSGEEVPHQGSGCRGLELLELTRQGRVAKGASLDTASPDAPSPSVVTAPTQEPQTAHGMSGMSI